MNRKWSQIRLRCQANPIIHYSLVPVFFLSSAVNTVTILLLPPSTKQRPQWWWSWQNKLSNHVRHPIMTSFGRHLVACGWGRTTYSNWVQREAEQSHPHRINILLPNENFPLPWDILGSTYSTSPTSTPVIHSNKFPFIRVVRWGLLSQENTIS